MSITIIATPGSATANSFVTEAEAIARAATRLNLPSSWVTVSGSTCTETEKAALIEATREITLALFQGQRVDATQVLSWPREFCVDPDAPLALGTATYVGYPYYANTVIPQRVKDATIELAFEFLKAGTADLAALDPKLAIKVETVDVLTTEYFAAGQRAQGLARFPRVANLLAPLLAASAGLPLVRC
jgi:hypothetical protein